VWHNANPDSDVKDGSIMKEREADARRQIRDFLVEMLKPVSDQVEAARQDSLHAIRSASKAREEAESSLEILAEMTGEESSLREKVEGIDNTISKVVDTLDVMSKLSGKTAAMQMVDQQAHRVIVATVAVHGILPSGCDWRQDYLAILQAYYDARSTVLRMDSVEAEDVMPIIDELRDKTDRYVRDICSRL